MGKALIFAIKMRNVCRKSKAHNQSGLNRDNHLGIDALVQYHSDRILTLLGQRDGNFAILKHAHPNFNFDEIIQVIFESESSPSYFYPNITLMPYGGNDAIEKSLFVLQVKTWSAAYNYGTVFYTVNLDGTLSLIEFLQPLFDERLDAVIMSRIAISTELTNAYINEQMVYTHRKWRGVGDAFEHGSWRLVRKNDEISAVLLHYEVDPSYDGESTPIEVFGLGKPLFKQGDVIYRK